MTLIKMLVDPIVDPASAVHSGFHINRGFLWFLFVCLFSLDQLVEGSMGVRYK